MDWESLIEDSADLSEGIKEVEERYDELVSEVGREAEELLEDVRDKQDDILAFAERLIEENDNPATDAAIPNMERGFSRLQEMEKELEEIVLLGKQARRRSEVSSLSAAAGFEELAGQLKEIVEGLEQIQQFTDGLSDV